MVEDLSDGHGDAARRLQSKLRELFGRVTSRHSSDAEIWEQYAKLYGDGRSDNPEDNDKVSGPSSQSLPAGRQGRQLTVLLKLLPSAEVVLCLWSTCH